MCYRNAETLCHPCTFKSMLIEEELAQTDDRSVINKLQKEIGDVSDLLDIDDQYPVADEAFEKPDHRHASLKSSCPTRWNSSLLMVESILDMKREVTNSLKRIGKVSMCLETEEIELLDELRNFLKPFESPCTLR